LTWVSSTTTPLPGIERTRPRVSSTITASRRLGRLDAQLFGQFTLTGQHFTAPPLAPRQGGAEFFYD
jgi:hypothetical protein